MDPKQLNRDETTRTQAIINIFLHRKGQRGKGEGMRCIPWEVVEEEEINQELAREDVDPEQAPEVLGAPHSSWRGCLLYMDEDVDPEQSTAAAAISSGSG